MLISYLTIIEKNGSYSSRFLPYSPFFALDLAKYAQFRHVALVTAIYSGMCDEIDNL